METNVKGNTALKSDEKVLMVTVPKHEENKPATMTVVKPTEKKPEAKKEVKTVKAEPVQQVKTLSFEEIRAKGENLFNLSTKYDQVKAKADELKKFKILHNKDVAQILLTDAVGNRFVSANPKAIEKFIAFCSEELQSTLKEVETEMRKIA